MDGVSVHRSLSLRRELRGGRGLARFSAHHVSLRTLPGSWYKPQGQSVGAGEKITSFSGRCYSRDTGCVITGKPTAGARPDAEGQPCGPCGWSARAPTSREPSLSAWPSSAPRPKPGTAAFCFACCFLALRYLDRTKVSVCTFRRQGHRSPKGGKASSSWGTRDRLHAEVERGFENLSLRSESSRLNALV